MTQLIVTLLLFASYSIAPAFSDDTQGTMAAMIAQDTGALCADEMAGRFHNEAGGKSARAWCVSRLEQAGMLPGTGTSFEQPFEYGVNLLALIPPKEGKPGNPKILLTAHYDGLGDMCLPHELAKSKVCNGCSDNAGSVAVLLAVAQALKGSLTQTVALVFFDSEESGLEGSRHFLNHPAFPMDELRLVINLDIVGANLFKGLEGNHLVIGAETGGGPLLEAVTQVAAQTGLATTQLSYGFGHQRSDLTSFVLKGAGIPFVLFTDGPGYVYHTQADEMTFFNQAKAARVAETVIALVQNVSAQAQGFSYTAPQLMGEYCLPVYKDLFALWDLLTQIQSHSSANQLSEQDQQYLREQGALLATQITAGEAVFGPEGAQSLGLLAQEIAFMSKRLGAAP